MTSADQESERLTALGGLAALSLDALSSVACGPEAILVVLVAAGTAGLRYSPQRGIILERAIRRGTVNVVLCRLRYRLATLTAASAAPAGVGDT